ncbi:MarR family winged helix-turn-helix transcriptional regulator [Micromonospora sp. NPDC048871]|uniref:MarR family winged helix-turn-helix transcriptional regulator n=1 Tax=unclassified Micromonospora TaxID=2617518 RepID=UPI002E1252BC|nr:MarR family transcriptional regulator [Micromonospora sp. NBC_01739]
MSMAAEVDVAAGALLTVWDGARERTANRISTAQLRAVMLVERQDGINLRRLAAGLDMLLSSASRLCDRLVAAGMLEREPGRADRREISLHLTAEARSLLTELREDRRQHLAAILGDMTPEGRTALLRGLQEFDEVARARVVRPVSSLVPQPEEPGSAHCGEVREVVDTPLSWSNGDTPVSRTA